MSESDTAVGAPDVAGLFAAARDEGRTLLLPYLTAGLPTPDDSLDLFKAMADAGADGFELGIPYSDPLMDGPTIHTAGLQSLAAGTTFEKAMGIVEDVVTATGLPVFVMTYVNPVLRHGVGSFTERIASAGASGLIVADLPVDEADAFRTAARESGVGTVLFVAPTTDDTRLDRVVAADPVFIYAVARLGVTGEQVTGGQDATANAASDATLASPLGALSARVRSRSDLPIVAGVGIATPEMAADAAEHVDGVIVGSALVRRVLEADTPQAAAASLHDGVAALSAALTP